MTTNIEWARNPDGSKGETWPVVTGCTPCSIGCANCYAARMAATRLKHHPRYEGLATIKNGKARWTGEVRLNHDALEQPLHWRKPRMVFIASMGDLFHPDVPFTFIVQVFNMMYNAPQHIYQVLTKRPYRMKAFIEAHEAWYASPIPDNIWLGVSVENQEQFDSRWYWASQTPAAVLFVSCEPLLNLIKFNARDWERLPDWVICGSESGPGARPMDEDWVRDLRDQCQAAGVSFFYKQKLVNGRKVSMPMLDGHVWDEIPKGEACSWHPRKPAGRSSSRYASTIVIWRLRAAWVAQFASLTSGSWPRHWPPSHRQGRDEVQARRGRNIDR